MASEAETPAPTATATFELRQFAWLTPDRLGVSGKFEGLPKAADGAPVLVLRAGDRVLRLPAAADSVGGPPEEGGIWYAAFEWRDAPVAFDAAALELGAGLVVELPEPEAKRRLSRRRVLDVRTASGGAEPPAAPDDSVERDAASVGSQVELLATQEELREVRVALEKTQQDLARAHDDLRAESERRTGDSERFRVGLAKLRESAEEALAVEQSAKRQLGDDLRQAQEVVEKNDAALKTLRERVAELERDAKETERLRTELERSRAQADAARTELEQARDAVDQARDDAERLLGRLTAISAK